MTLIILFAPPLGINVCLFHIRKLSLWPRVHFYLNSAILVSQQFPDFTLLSMPMKLDFHFRYQGKTASSNARKYWHSKWAISTINLHQFLIALCPTYLRHSNRAAVHTPHFAAGFASLTQTSLLHNFTFYSFASVVRVSFRSLRWARRNCYSFSLCSYIIPWERG